VKRIAIVGVGVGSLTEQAAEEIDRARVLIGASRMIAAYDKEKYAEYVPDEVARIVRENRAERFAVLVSGDPCFYSAAGKISKALAEHDVSIIPGISALQAFCARLKRSWEDVAVAGCHGGEDKVVEVVRRNKNAFVLTGGNIDRIGKKLTERGFGGLRVCVGEDLGLERERIFETTVRALRQNASLTVLLVENPNFDDRARSGISDEEFIRGDVPMTKAEVRAIVMSKLSLSPGDVCADIGAGTGGVTVEMALAAYDGRVYAIDKERTACALIEQNLRKFRVGNAETINGEATRVLDGLPAFDAAFLGGCGGKTKEITERLLAKNPKTRIVATAIKLDTLRAALAALPNAECVQIGTARLKNGMLIANNPTFVVHGGET
jgi:precorrin-6Y C5,15-methyltransferase (decarboxylating)